MGESGSNPRMKSKSGPHEVERVDECGSSLLLLK
jgi:hypothetical protein